MFNSFNNTTTTTTTTMAAQSPINIENIRQGLQRLAATKSESKPASTSTLEKVVAFIGELEASPLIPSVLKLKLNNWKFHHLGSFQDLRSSEALKIAAANLTILYLDVIQPAIVAGKDGKLIDYEDKLTELLTPLLPPGKHADDYFRADQATATMFDTKDACEYSYWQQEQQFLDQCDIFLENQHQHTSELNGKLKSYVDVYQQTAEALSAEQQMLLDAITNATKQLEALDESALKLSATLIAEHSKLDAIDSQCQQQFNKK